MLFPCQIHIRKDDKLEQAKKYPLESIYTGKLHKTGKVLVGVCPFHQDDTPSFTIYPETNTFFCFGCHESGDSIKLYQKLHDCGFRDALEALA